MLLCATAEHRISAAGLKVSRAPPPRMFRLLPLINVTDVSGHACDLRQRKTRQANLSIFVCLPATGTVLPRPALSFTEAISLDLLFSSCYWLNEEVVSKHILKYCSSDFPKECFF